MATPSGRYTAETAPTQRDRHIQLIEERGRLGWQRAVDYGKRSLAEVAMFRYKKVIGRTFMPGLCPDTRPMPQAPPRAPPSCPALPCRFPAGSPDFRGKG